MVEASESESEVSDIERASSSEMSRSEKWRRSDEEPCMNWRS